MKKLFLTLLLLFLSTPQNQAIANEDPTLSEITKRIRHNKTTFKFLGPFLLHPRRAGERDDYKIYYPKNYDSKKQWPLVVLLHGIYVSGSFQDHFFGLKKQVTKKGFVLLIPGSTYNEKGMRFWNSSHACCDFFESNVDDVGYLSNLISKVKMENKIDPHKISVLGHSNGAMMAQRLACDTENLITKVVSYAGVLDQNFNCENKGPLQLVLYHDQDDEHILYQGMSDFEFNYRMKNDELYPLKTQYVGAIENYERWKKVMSHATIELVTTQGKGHMPKLSRLNKRELIDFLIQ